MTPWDREREGPLNPDGRIKWKRDPEAPELWDSAGGRFTITPIRGYEVIDTHEGGNVFVRTLKEAKEWAHDEALRCRRGEWSDQ